MYYMCPGIRYTNMRLLAVTLLRIFILLAFTLDSLKWMAADYTVRTVFGKEQRLSKIKEKLMWKPNFELFMTRLFFPGIMCRFDGSAELV